MKLDSSSATPSSYSTIESSSSIGRTIPQSSMSHAKETKAAAVTVTDSDKLQRDLNVLAERNTMCQEILLVSPGIAKDDLLKESIGFLEACRDRMVDLIDAGAQGLLSEEIFALILKINDDVMKTLHAEKVYSLSVVQVYP